MGDAHLVSEPEPDSVSAAVYEQRVNAAMDFIQDNLGRDLQLAQVAKAAGFSPFHFHRLFAALVGETLSAFVARQRTERAAALLIDQPKRTISAIGADCGFGTPSAFARAFKNFYGVTPGDWRAAGSAADRPPSRFATPMAAADVRHDGMSNSWTLTIGTLAPARVSIAELDRFDVAYLRHTGRFQGAAEVFAELFERVRTWAASVGIDTSTTETIAWYHDDPNLTDDELLRFSACIAVSVEVPTTAPVNRASLAGGTYAIAEFELGDDDYGSAWNGLLGSWLPQSGFESDARQYFERFVPNASDGPLRSVEICVPVRPLRGGVR